MKANETLPRGMKDQRQANHNPDQWVYLHWEIF
jgi:hypothetical protein